MSKSVLSCAAHIFFVYNDPATNTLQVFSIDRFCTLKIKKYKSIKPSKYSNLIFFYFMLTIQEIEEPRWKFYKRIRKNWIIYQGKTLCVKKKGLKIKSNQIWQVQIKGNTCVGGRQRERERKREREIVEYGDEDRKRRALERLLRNLESNVVGWGGPP